jgi:hypothetical protein
MHAIKYVGDSGMAALFINLGLRLVDSPPSCCGHFTAGKGGTH